MSDELTKHEKAFEAAMPGVSPKGLMEAVKNPHALVEAARADLYVELARMRELMKSPTVSVPQRMQYLERLAKMANISAGLPEEQQRETRPTINIIFEGNEQESVSARPAIEYDPERIDDV